MHGKISETKTGSGGDFVEWSRNEECSERKVFYLNFFTLLYCLIFKKTDKHA